MPLLKVRPKDAEVWSETEKTQWRVPERLTVSEWADKNRVLSPLSSSEPGQWRTIRTPYLKGVMDAFNDPFVEKITFCASTQVGKTEAWINMIGYTISEDPGPTMIVLPREADAKSLSKNRIQPMIELSPTLNAHRTGRRDDEGQLEYKLNNLALYFAWAGSAASLSSRPVRNVFNDETDKYPKFTGDEADPIKLGTERTRTFWNRKVVNTSTPTKEDGYIWRELQQSDYCKYHVPCPHCGEYQVLLFPRIKWPEDATADEIHENRLAWYECESCEKRIEDKFKGRMISLGVWVPKDAKVNPDGTLSGNIQLTNHKGFWINCLYSPWLTFSDIAAEFLRSHKHAELLMNFVNSWLAEPWREKMEETEEHQIMQRVQPYRQGQIDAGALVLTAGIDVQKDHFWGIIRGWGYDMESWQVRAFRCETWEEVIAALFRTQYEKRNAAPLSVRLACIDSGYRTDEVYEVCKRFRDVARATKGQESNMSGLPFKVSTIDRDPRSGQVIKGGLQLWHVDTTYFKDKIHRFIHAESGYPGQFWIPEDVPEVYAKHMVAEKKVPIRDKKRGIVAEKWVQMPVGAPNHFLDCEVLALAAAEMLHLSALRRDQQIVTYQPDDGSRYRRGGGKWIQRRSTGGWLSGR